MSFPPSNFDSPEWRAKRYLGDARYAERHKFPKWNITPTVLQEPRLFARVFPELTREDHARLQHHFERKYEKLRTLHTKAIARAEKVYGPGNLISGGFSEHWPSSTKDVVRRYAHAGSLSHEAAKAHGYASKLRSIPARDASTSRDCYGLHFHGSEKAARDLSPQKRAAVSRKIRLLIGEGYPPKQAAAIAYRMGGISRAPAKKKARQNPRGNLFYKRTARDDGAKAAPRPFDYPKKREAPTTDDSQPCTCCGKRVVLATAKHAVHVVGGGARYGGPSDTGDAGDMGWFPVGPSCARRLAKAGVYVGKWQE